MAGSSKFLTFSHETGEAGESGEAEIDVVARAGRLSASLDDAGAGSPADLPGTGTPPADLPTEEGSSDVSSCDVAPDDPIAALLHADASEPDEAATPEPEPEPEPENEPAQAADEAEEIPDAPGEPDRNTRAGEDRVDGRADSEAGGEAAACERSREAESLLAAPAPAGPADERAVSRLLDATNARLGDTEGSRRRSAIAHLKAAVAATRAERRILGRKEPLQEESLSRFRGDLAVVQPRRPVAQPAGDAGARACPADPLASRPAPLILASAQRIDGGGDPVQTVVQTIVHPRRVGPAPQAGSAAGSASDAEIGFAEFVRARGATELPDILESAVAYAALREEQTEVARPDLIRRVAGLRPDLSITREMGLLGVERLLRQGRIRKVGHGHVSLADAPATRGTGSKG